MKSDSAIQVKNLSKVYYLRQPELDKDGENTYEHWALKNVSFEIKKGTSVGIIGPNGSGKSTLLKILAGVTIPTTGSVKVRGRIASILDIGTGFHPELSGKENVFLNGQIHGFTKKEIEDSFEEIIAFSGIGKFINEPVKNYSSGMYLRLAFSIMAHLDFDVYLFDEVLGVGDAVFRDKSQQKIKYLTTKEDKTVLLISHSMSELAVICNWVFTVNNGNISNLKTLNESLLTYGLNDSLNNEIPNFIKHLNVITQNNEGQAQSIFYNNDSIKIEITNLFKTKENTCNIAITVTDQLGNLIFNTSPILELSGIVEIDFYKKESFIFEIPSLYFNEGKFFIGIAYFKEDKIIAEVDRICSFTIQMNPMFMDKYKLGENGPLKPIQNWIIK